MNQVEYLCGLAGIDPATLAGAALVRVVFVDERKPFMGWYGEEDLLWPRGLGAAIEVWAGEFRAMTPPDAAAARKKERAPRLLADSRQRQGKDFWAVTIPLTAEQFAEAQALEAPK
jgi:hypothetical protein